MYTAHYGEYLLATVAMGTGNGAKTEWRCAIRVYTHLKKC